MKFIELKDGHVIVAVKGSLNIKIAEELQDELIEALGMGENSIIVDMSNTEYIDSTGLGVFVTLKEKLEETNGKIIVTGLKGYCLEVFKTTRLIEEFS